MCILIHLCGYMYIISSCVCSVSPYIQIQLHIYVYIERKLFLVDVQFFAIGVGGGEGVDA